MHLRYSVMTAVDRNENRHPQEVMRELGITYKHATPQSIADSWWFWNCRSIPEKLPAYIAELKIDPMTVIGNGLSRQDAEMIAAQTGDDLA